MEWPDVDINVRRAASIASWPEIAAGGGHTLQLPSDTPPGRPSHTHRPSLVELQRLRADGRNSPDHQAEAASTLLGARRRPTGPSSCVVYSAASVASVLMVGTAAFHTLTMLEHPAYKLYWYDTSWSTAWLLSAAVEVAGARLCACGIVIASERYCCGSLFWVAVCLIAGTPGLCGYMLWRLMRHGSLSLKSERLGSSMSGRHAHVQLPNQYC